MNERTIRKMLVIGELKDVKKSMIRTGALMQEFDLPIYEHGEEMIAASNLVQIWIDGIEATIT